MMISSSSLCMCIHIFYIHSSRVLRSKGIRPVKEVLNLFDSVFATALTFLGMALPSEVETTGELVSISTYLSIYLMYVSICLSYVSIYLSYLSAYLLGCGKRCLFSYQFTSLHQSSSSSLPPPLNQQTLQRNSICYTTLSQPTS